MFFASFGDPGGWFQDNVAPRVTIFTGIDPSEPDYSRQTTLTLDTYIQTKSSAENLKGFVKVN